MREQILATTTAEGAAAAEGRGIEDAVSYAVGSGIRIEILAALNEAVLSQGALARRLHLPQSTIQHHVTELLRSGSIEEIEPLQVRNLMTRRYRALRKSEHSAAEYREMSEEDRRTTVGFTLQNAIAEHLAAFRAGQIQGEDPNLILTWDWFTLDDEGQAEMAAELEGTWRRMKEIEARATNRRALEQETGESIIVSLIAHPRVRPAPQDKALGSLLEPES